MYFKIFIFLSLLYSLGIVIAIELTAEFVSHLPKPLYLHSAIYDGEDSIYIFGGNVNVSHNVDIYRYSLSNFSISSVGKLLTGSNAGTTHADSNGNIFYIGGTNIQKFNVGTQNTTWVADLPYNVDYGTSVKYNNQVIIMGGFGGCHKTLSFDLVSNTVTEIGTLPIPFCEGAASKVGNYAFLFGGSYSPLLIELNLETFQTRLHWLEHYPAFRYPESVSDGGKYIYVGLGQMAFSGMPSQGIYQFDTETYRTDYIYISNFFKDREYFLNSPANVYVEKENRIYFFGGLTNFLSNPSYINHDEIWYVDLSQLDPTVPTTTEGVITTTPIVGTTIDPDIFNCKNRTDGSYSHPSDCAQFIICRDGETELFECQPPLLFDPLLGTCNWPDSVDYGLTCVDKPDGPYPHPHDCALFIVCHGGKLDVFKCSEGLLFDQVFKVCRYADLVDCDGE